MLGVRMIVVTTKTCPCNEYSLIPTVTHFYVANIGFIGIHLFLVFAVGTHSSSSNDCIPTKILKISIIFQ